MQLKELLETMLRFPKPIIAAVNGPAVGAGAGLVLASDIVLGTRRSVRIAGTSAGPCRGNRLSALVVSRWRRGCGEPAPDRSAGIRSKGVAARHLPSAGSFRPGLGSRPRNGRPMCAVVSRAIQLTKRMLNETIGEHLSTLLNAGAAVAATARTTEAAEEGLAAFVEKREPQWK